MSEILEILADGEFYSTGELAILTGLAESTVYRHTGKISFLGVRYEKKDNKLRVTNTDVAKKLLVDIVKRELALDKFKVGVVSWENFKEVISIINAEAISKEEAIIKICHKIKIDKKSDRAAIVKYYEKWRKNYLTT